MPVPGHTALPRRDENATLGTFVGVFRPTLLTIIGLVMYLREGWVVGNAGVLGALVIVGATFLITGTTALSFASITTNIRIGSGGAFSIVSQSLGLEAGGAVGIPLYLAQSLSIAFYIYGFSEGWHYLFPEHPRAVVLAVVFATGFGLSFFSEKLALRLQVVVMLGVVLALGCIAGGLFTAPTLHAPQWIGSFEDTDLRGLFAVFFPAGTGIMVGASMSGKLREPRRSIPRGILGAWGVTFFIYVALVFWFATVSTPGELRANNLVSVDHSAWRPGVLIGLLSSCFSAMLGSSVAAPNVLAALGRAGVVPRADFFGRQASGGTPRNAVAGTAVLVALALTLGTLNRVAGFITMFFLIAYATINIVLLVEQSLRMISFRPTFEVPILVPAFGAVSAVFAMVITNPTVGVTALAVVVALYIHLARRRIETPWETVRSGVVVAFADWAARATQRINGPIYRAWKPDILLPVAEDGVAVRREQYLLEGLVRPRGSIRILAVVEPGVRPPRRPELDGVVADLRRARIYATRADIVGTDAAGVVRAGSEVLQGSFLCPNLLWAGQAVGRRAQAQALLEVAQRKDMGFVLYVPHPDRTPRPARVVNVWLREPGEDLELSFKLANVDLAVLLGYQLHRNWRAKMRLVTLIGDPARLEAGRAYSRRLAQEARLPPNTELFIEAATFPDDIVRVPPADLHVMGLQERIELPRHEALVRQIGAPVLFVRDSSQESALA